VIFVSSGKPLVTVPDVTTQTEADAKSTLERAGFVVRTTTETDATAQPGTVTRQDPAPNTQARAGSTVTIVVAQAPTTATVPDVRGETGKAAQATLTAAGFTVTETTQNVSRPNQDGLVISQSPAAGKTVSKGSNVSIVVGHYQQKTTTTTTSTTTTSTTSQKPSQPSNTAVT
jgi:serine/threonine-protein kinase